MSSIYNRNDVHEAANAVKEAQITLKTMVETVWPKGTEVKVKIGRATITAEVTGYGSYWANAGTLFGTNTVTRKARHFHYTQIIENHDE